MAAIMMFHLLSYFRARMGMMILITLLSLSGFSSANASPTSNEFEECHVLASKYLLKCLNENMNNIHIGQCWIQSKSSYDHCHSKVMKRHDRAEMKKRKKVRQEAEAKELNKRSKSVE